MNHNNQSISFRRAFAHAWDIYRVNVWFYTKIILSFFIAWVLLELAVYLGQDLGPAFNLVVHLLFLVIFAGLEVGFIQICLDANAGYQPHYPQFFEHFKQGPKFLVAQLAYIILVLIGLVFLLIPGLYYGTRYAFNGFIIAEKDFGIIESFNMSANITRGLLGKLFTCFLLLTLLNLFGAMWLGLGLLVTIPVSVLTMASFYLNLKISE
jgi:hypothetical protein